MLAEDRARAIVELVRSEGFQAIDALASENSDWFRVVTAVRIGTSEFTLYSLMQRDGPNSIRTVLRSTGTE